MGELPASVMATQWWVRPRFDGGCDYVRLRLSGTTTADSRGSIEWIEGSHLPPQMPLLKRRLWVSAELAQHRQQQLQACGFEPSQPVF
jgi:hypothetical protein